MEILALYAPNQQQIKFIDYSLQKLHEFQEGYLKICAVLNYIADLAMDGYEEKMI